jgi:Domain of unknown function (DUF4349)
MTSPETLELEAVDAALAGRYVAPEHAELAELALLLRDDRPAPTAVWATHMDRRVEAGFHARPRRRPRLGAWWKPVAVVAALLLPVALVAVLSAGSGSNFGSDDSGGGGGGSAGSTASDQAAPTGGSDDSASPGQMLAGSGVTTDSRARRSVQRSAALTLAAPRREIDGVAARVGQITADVGGYVASSAITSSDGGDLDLRVPTNRLDTAIQRVSKLARVRELTRQSLDITSQVVSARERLRDARTERESLLRQLASAVTVNETESIRARLRIVSREIAAARAAVRRVENRASFADVRVTLVRSRGGGDDAGAWTPGDAFHDALRVLEVAAGVAVIAAAVALPLLIAWLLGWLARRGVTRRRRERALDMA